MEQSNSDVNLNNALNQDKFKIVFRQLKEMELLCQAAPIPGVSGNAQEIPNSFNKIMVQGQKLNYDPFAVTFRVDRNLTSYIRIYEWIRDIHSPQEARGFLQRQNEDQMLKTSGYTIGVDASLFSLTNSMNPNIEVRFVGIFPVSLTSIDFNLADQTNVTATATFSYDYFEFKTDSSPK